MDKIIQYSIERSGSTLMTQILKRLFPGMKINKVHGFLKGVEHPIVVTYRDFRDVMVSRWRVQEDIPLKDLDIGRKMNSNEISEYLGSTIERVKILNRMRRTYEKNLITMQYEKFIEDYDYIFDELEVFFNDSFSEKLRQDIKQYSSLEANTKRSLKFKSFHNGNWDLNLIHGLHIYKKGQPGIWKQLVPKNKHDSVNFRFKEHLEQWGYKV